MFFSSCSWVSGRFAVVLVLAKEKFPHFSVLVAFTVASAPLAEFHHVGGGTRFVDHPAGKN